MCLCVCVCVCVCVGARKCLYTCVYLNFSLQSMHNQVAKENAEMKPLQSHEKDIETQKTTDDSYKKALKNAETYRSLYHEAESKRSAAASLVEDLTEVVMASAKSRVDTERIERLREEIIESQRQHDVRRDSTNSFSRGKLICSF